LPGIEYILFVFLGFFASIVSSMFGLGSALIVLTLGAYLLPTQELIALSTVLFATSTISKSILFRRAIDWRLAIQIALLSLPFAYLGVYAMLNTSPALLRRLLGAMILMYLLHSHLSRHAHYKLGKTGLLIGSATYGFVSGFLGSGNIVKAMVLQRVNMDKEAFVGIMAATSVLANITKLTALTQSGIYRAELYSTVAALALAGLFAALLGRVGLRKISEKQFQFGLQWVLGACALGLLAGA